MARAAEPSDRFSSTFPRPPGGRVGRPPPAFDSEPESPPIIATHSFEKPRPTLRPADGLAGQRATVLATAYAAHPKRFPIVAPSYGVNGSLDQSAKDPRAPDIIGATSVSACSHGCVRLV